jgi:alpha-glucosidase (family GH31 glycosyl hydrolase)
MYPLGDQFLVDYRRAKSDPKNCVTGKYYRISIITDRVVRLEYCPSGIFVDKPTQLIQNRNLGTPVYTIRQDANMVQVSTKYFELTYMKEQPFAGNNVNPAKNLKITLASTIDKDRQRDWYYKHPEVRNMKGNISGYDIPLNAANERGLYSIEGFASFDDSGNKLLEADGTLSDREPGSIDIYVFMYDKDFKEALVDYFKITGFPELLPRYALGNWWSRNLPYDEEGVRNIIYNFEKKRIPLSVIVLDHGWHNREFDTKKDLETGFTFNSKLFPNPQNLIKELHEKNIRVGLAVNPEEGFYPIDPLYSKVAEYLGASGNNLIQFDPLNPKFLDVYFKMYLHPLEAMGVDFFWNDYKDTKSITKMWSMTHYMYHDSDRSANKRGLVLSRGSIVAPQRYPVIYGGDTEITWEDLAKQVFTYINASNMGISWLSLDVGGTKGGIEESELYIRQVQLGCFSPILRFHAEGGPYYKKEPWVWEAKTTNIVAEFLRLRHRFIPYLYTEAYNYSRLGIPIIQPFYYNYPWCYDDELYKNQFYFGSQLLVCPILTRKDSIMNRTIHRFYMPDGIWYDFFTGKKFPGGKKYVSFIREEDYPVFAPAGAIIPLSNKSDRNNIGLATEMEIHIFPGVSNMYTLYEDDGITSLYKEGYFLKTSIDYNYLRSNYTVIIRAMEGKSGIAPDRRDYKLVFRNTKHADSVKVMFNTQEVKSENYTDGNDFIVMLRGIPTVGQLTVNCRGKDIEIDAVRVINDDVDSILMDLQINTYLKEDIAGIIFGDQTIQKKRIAIRKLKKKGLTKDHIQLFLKLLEYISEV